LTLLTVSQGDRTTPFLAVPRGKRSYQEIWAEEDTVTISIDNGDKLPQNQSRGNVEQITDDNLATDQISTGPLASRLLSLLKFEHRSPQNDINGNGDLNSFMADGNDTMDLDGLGNGHDFAEKPLPPAAAVADQAPSKSSNSQRLDYVQSEERLKAELRHLGFLGQDENPDYEAHHDDDISERLRLLQAELRRVMIINGARKARLLDLAKERLAFQEYSTIHEDLDSQVQQAYLKRTRTLGKTKKGGPGANKPKAGSHAGAAGLAMAVNRARDIGDSARMLMDRRRRWEDCIGPVFRDMKHGIPDKDTTLWDPKIMETYEKAELEALEEEAEAE
jgi:transcriptional adapter 3